MLTKDEFTAEWQRLHHPSMNVGSDVTFFYDLYIRLHRLAEQEATAFDEQLILSLLLYTENTIAIGLDGVYEYRYRCVGDMVFRWCESLNMSANTTSQVDRLVSEAVADTPCSALRGWMTECVRSGDFFLLSEMLTWFAREDKILQHVYPDLRYRKEMFMQLAGNRQTAGKMLWADLAFNWHDKRGYSLSDTIAKQFRLSSSTIGEKERALLKDAAESLDTIRSERMDTYSVIERKDRRTFTLRHRNGRTFRDVTSLTSIPENAQSGRIVSQLVTYNERTYINSPVIWLADETQADWNGESVWNSLFKKEQDAAKQMYFTTTFGKRINLYEDLYTVPEDPEEAYYTDMGIFFDEPNIFDFLKWLKPSKSVTEMSK